LRPIPAPNLAESSDLKFVPPSFGAPAVRVPGTLKTSIKFRPNDSGTK
jgi:hypothetical protein